MTLPISFHEMRFWIGCLRSNDMIVVCAAQECQEFRGEDSGARLLSASSAFIASLSSPPPPGPQHRAGLPAHAASHAHTRVTPHAGTGRVSPVSTSPGPPAAVVRPAGRIAVLSLGLPDWATASQPASTSRSSPCQDGCSGQDASSRQAAGCCPCSANGHQQSSDPPDADNRPSVTGRGDSDQTSTSLGGRPSGSGARNETSKSLGGRAPGSGASVLRTLFQLKALVRERRCAAVVTIPAGCFEPSSLARMQVRWGDVRGVLRRPHCFSPRFRKYKSANLGAPRLPSPQSKSLP